MSSAAKTAKRVLWPTDFSRSATDALGVAAELAAAYQAELVLFHVISDPAEEVTGAVEREGREASSWALWRIAKHEIEARLARFAAERGLGEGRWRVLSGFGDPAARIVDLVRELAIDVIVLSARREKSLLRERLLGPVAYQVVRTAPCHVLVVK